MHLENKASKIFVAGHRGLVGSAILRQLEKSGYTNILTASSKELDLRNQADVRTFFAAQQPEFVVMAAARVGGILANSESPVQFLEDNLAIELNAIQCAHSSGVKRLLFLGSSCVYPKLAPQPLKEEYLLSGPLEATNQWYAVAKIAGIKLCEAYHQQYGSDFISLMPTNLYGPGDNFDLHSSHVLPALIRKFHEAKVRGKNEVELWGTGTPKREFLYVDDLAEACEFLLTAREDIVDAHAQGRLINVGTGTDLTIKELATLIQEVTGASNTQLRFDTSKPDGTPRKLMDVSIMAEMGWSASTDLRDGIAKTYQWYLDHDKSQ